MRHFGLLRIQAGWVDFPLRAEVAPWAGFRSQLYQLHRLEPETVRRVALRLAKRESVR